MLTRMLFNPLLRAPAVTTTITVLPHHYTQHKRTISYQLRAPPKYFVSSHVLRQTMASKHTKPATAGSVHGTPHVLMMIANGSEEIETVSTIDVLRRGGCEVTIAAVGSSKSTVGGQKVNIVADVLFSELTDAKRAAFHAIVLPGGHEGSKALSKCTELINLLRQYNEQSKIIAAICAAPAVVLANHDLLQGRRATCYPSPDLVKSVGELYEKNQGVVKDCNLITAQGPAMAIDFGLHIVSALSGSSKAEEVAKALLVKM